MALLERENALAELDAALAEAGAGRGGVVLVGGEAGVGKTALIAAFARRCGARAAVLLGHCDPLITPDPLGPLHDISRGAGGELHRLLQDGAPRARIFAATLERLSAGPRPVVLVLEDVHWADEATLDLASFLARRIAACAALLVLTFRDDELGSDHPLRRVLGTLAPLPGLRRLELAPLSLAAVRRLVGERRLDAAALHRATGGNPFFLGEIIAAGGEGVPATVRDAVLARCARIAPAGRALLEQLAVLGARIAPRVVARLAGFGPDAFEQALASGIVRRDDDGGLAFRHELARVAVLAAMNPARRPDFARAALAIVGAETGEARGELARLAQFAEDAGDAAATIAWGVKAAAAASALGAHREAAAQYRRVLRAAAARPAAERAGWLEGLARSCHLLDGLDEAIAAYREAAALHRAAGDRRRAAAALAELAWPLVRAAENEAAEAACREAIAILETLEPSPDLANALRIKAHLRMLDRDRDAATRWGDEAIALASRLGEERIVAEAEMVVGTAALVSGDDAGMAALDRCLAFARARGFEPLIALAHLNIGSSQGEQFRLAEAERALAEGLAFARGRDLDHSRHYMEAWLALVRLWQGRWSEAADAAATVLAEPHCAAISRIMALAALGRLRARRGDPGAMTALDEALALAERSRTLQRLAPVRLARAEAAWLRGDHAAARAEAEAVHAPALAHRHRWHAGEAIFWQVRAGADLVMPEWVAAPHRLRHRGDWRGAAAEWMHLGCPYEQADALADGDIAAQREALAIFARLGAAPMAAALSQTVRRAGVRTIPRGPRAATRANRFGLTARQTAILEALLEGLSNKEIAARLRLSPRTVDHHVSAVLAKLEVATRQEAVRLVRRMESAAPT